MSRPLSILHVITSTQVGGAETQLAQLVAATAGGGLRHFVVGLSAPGPRAAAMMAAGAQVVSLGLHPGPAAVVKGLPPLVRLMRQVRPHVVQTWLYHADLLGLLAARVAQAGPVVWGVRCSDMDLARYRLATRLVVRSCAALSGQPAAIVTNSHAGAQLHVRLGYPAHKLRVIPNGYDTQHFRPDPQAREEVRGHLKLAPRELLVGHAARFDPMKDHATFLAAAARLAQRLPTAHFLCLGLGVEPSNPALRAAILPPLAGRVHLLGRREDAARWLAALDVHVSSSAFGEGLSNAVGEAMACGVPNVVTRVGDSAELVGETGRSVPPRSPEALAAALEELLSLPAASRLELGQAARRRIEEHYSLAAMASAYLGLYGSLAGKR